MAYGLLKLTGDGPTICFTIFINVFLSDWDNVRKSMKKHCLVPSRPRENKTYED